MYFYLVKKSMEKIELLFTFPKNRENLASFGIKL